MFALIPIATCVPALPHLHASLALMAIMEPIALLLIATLIFLITHAKLAIQTILLYAIHATLNTPEVLMERRAPSILAMLLTNAP